jgi:S1-C subfamily serine protease
VNVLDLIIVLAAIAFGIGGFRNGAIVGFLSLVGFFTGAIVGAQIAQPLGRLFAKGQSQIPVAIVCVLFAAMVGQLLGVWAAGYLKRRFVTERLRPLDSSVGSALGVFSVLLVSWMVAVPLASSPYPALSSAASHSRIVRTVNSVMPDDVRTLYGSLRQFLDRSGFPPVLGDLPSITAPNVAPPDKTLSPALQAVVRKAQLSTFKIYGEAPSCSRQIEGSGFEYAPEHVMTNAHVVAGTDRVGVQVDGQTVAARVVLFDPKRDVAVLYVPGLDAPTMAFAPAPAERSEAAVVLGFPEDQGYTSRSARIRSRIEVDGNDIYGQSHVRREIYSVRAVVRSGNSGGPLVDSNGKVLGVVFATALDSSDTGYALTAAEVAPDATAGRTATTGVATGACTSG